MITSSIKENIYRLLKERQWKISDLENKIGKGRPVKNILSGSSRNPTIEVLTSIANAFDVQIQDLLVDHPADDKMNLNLMTDVCLAVTEELSQTATASLTYHGFFGLIKDVYEYSVNLKLQSADRNFTKWLINGRYK